MATRSDLVEVVLLMPPIQRSIANPRYKPGNGEPKILTTHYTEKGQSFKVPKSEAQVWIAQKIVRLASDVPVKKHPVTTSAVGNSSRVVSPEELANLEGDTSPIADAAAALRNMLPRQAVSTDLDDLGDDLDDPENDPDMDTVDDDADADTGDAHGETASQGSSTGSAQPNKAKLEVNKLPNDKMGIELINNLPIAGLGQSRATQILERRPESGYENITHLMGLNPEFSKGSHRVSPDDLAEHLSF